MLLATWFQWLSTKLMFFCFCFTLSSKFLLNPAAVLSCIHCFFFFFALPVGATEERPEPSLKMVFSVLKMFLL